MIRMVIRKCVAPDQIAETAKHQCAERTNREARGKSNAINANMERSSGVHARKVGDNRGR